MFNDGHGGDSNGNTDGYDGRRYPGSAQVGIPLFDYPTHEGWFDFKNGKKQFSAENPDANLEFLRIYWPNNNRTNNSYIHVWASNPGWNGTEFNTNEGAIDPETGYYYYDFVKRDTWTLNTKIHSMLYKDNSNSGEYTLDKFTDIGKRVSAITIDENRNFANSGKPKLESDIKLASNKYRIYWKAKSTFTAQLLMLYMLSIVLMPVFFMRAIIPKQVVSANTITLNLHLHPLDSVLKSLSKNRHHHGLVNLAIYY